MISILLTIGFLALAGYIQIEVIEPRVPGGVFGNGDAYEKRQADKAEQERIKTQYRIKFEKSANNDYLHWRVYAPGRVMDYAKMGTVSRSPSYYSTGKKNGTWEDALERAEKEARDWIATEERRTLSLSKDNPLDKVVFVKRGKA